MRTSKILIYFLLLILCAGGGLLFIRGQNIAIDSQTIRDISSLKESQKPPFVEFIQAGALSKDENYLAFIGRNSKGDMRLFVKPLKEDKIWEISDSWMSCAWDGQGVLWFDQRKDEELSIWKWSFGSSPQLVIKEGLRPCPSIDGKRIAFEAFGREESYTGLSIYDVETKKKFKILTDRTVVSWCWSPEEEIIAVCLPTLKESESGGTLSVFPSLQGRLIVVNLSPYREKIIAEDVAAKSVPICLLKNGNIVYQKVKPSLFGGPYVEFWEYEKSQEWHPKLLWREQVSERRFGISDDGRYLMTFRGLDDSASLYEVRLVDLQKGETRSVAQGGDIMFFIYSPSWDGFFVGTMEEVFFIDKEGHRRNLL